MSTNTTSIAVRCRITLEDAMESVCRLAAEAHPSTYSQFDVNRLTKAAIRMQQNLDDYNRSPHEPTSEHKA